MTKEATLAPAPGKVTLKPANRALYVEWQDVYEDVVARRAADTILVDARPRDMYTGKWLAWFRAWVHEIVLRERRQAEAPRFRDFAAQGDLIIIPDDSEQDIADVADIARQVVMSGLLDKVGVDPVGIGAIVDALIDETCGVDQDKIVGIKQGYSLMGPIKTAERKLAAGSLVHSDSPLLAWCVGNCKAEPKGNAIIITKQASGFAKIDPVMALFDASALMSLAPAQNVIGADYELTTA